MTAPPEDAAIDVAGRTQDLLSGLIAQPWGEITASVYETGRLVALAPWLSGHERRVEFLLEQQGSDGAWGGPDGYLLVPTLSATEALLAALARADPSGDRSALVCAVHRGLAALFHRLSPPARIAVPDTPAVELIVPALVALINQHLDRMDAGTPQSAGLDAWRGPARLHLPAGLDDRLLMDFRARLAAGQALPDKLAHSLEVFGAAAAGCASVRLADLGTVGASPAATASWLASPGPGRSLAAHRYLDSVVQRFGGPVPSVLPITTFERSWVLGTLARCTVDCVLPESLLQGLAGTLGPQGTAGGEGLPPDADTTAMTLFVLSTFDSPGEAERLRAFETDTHFVTWAGERTASATVNAHVLDLLGNHLFRGVAFSPWYATAMRKAAQWVQGQQHEDGFWVDKWHASPYYATTRCALALNRLAGATASVNRAVAWVLASQRADGSWGRWDGSLEETAYALQLLLLARPTPVAATVTAAARGLTYLRRVVDSVDQPALWHDKDLYRPGAVVRAAALGAIKLGQADPRLATIVTNTG